MCDGKKVCSVGGDSFGYFPGSIMSQSAEALANISGRRNVTIEISNSSSSYVFIDPKIYTESGHTHVPPGPTITPMKTEICNFSKTSAKTSGAVGLLSYDVVRLQGKPRVVGKLVIMYSVPYDQNAYANWVGLGIFSPEVEVNEDLYKKMYYDKEPQGFVRAKAGGSVLTYTGQYLDVMATMSPLGRAIMKVQIWEKVFSPPMAQGPY
ncbi:DELTA-actitoxin-Afr1e-like [Halichoeres trimaculatus]|uniref:DELTA-actitoxin-Afr1e-like n=1 Tax=Halichoeres trimaculatus TaxID=147232 RepID=UPI003D9EA531